MFYGRTFIYNGTSSDIYNLFISSFDSGEATSNGSSNVNVYSETLYRRSKPYFFGTQQTPTLEFDISFFSPDEIHAWDVELIQAWLFGQPSHKKFQVIQEDVQDIYWNVLLKDPQIIRNGNMIVGFTCRAVADSPFAWQNEGVVTRTFASGAIDQRITFYNLSDENYYLYPRIVFRTGGTGGTIRIKNETENNRESIFTGIGLNETITMDSYYQILTSTSGIKRLSNFNKKWFRLLKDKNSILLNGNITSFSMYYQFSKKMGG